MKRNFREIVKDRKPSVLQCMRSQRVGHDLATKQQQQPCFAFYCMCIGKPLENFKQRSDLIYVFKDLSGLLEQE